MALPWKDSPVKSSAILLENVQKIAGWLHGKSVAEVANIARTKKGKRAAETSKAIKILKRAKKYARQY